MAFDVFISHSHHDKSTADAVCAALEAKGIRCWIAPRDVQPGADWAAAIVDAIDHCRVMVLIFSSSANESKQIHREVERAFEREVAVVPFRVEDIAPEKALAYYIGPVHWLDALSPPLEQHLQRLVALVNTLIATSNVPHDHIGETKPKTDSVMAAPSPRSYRNALLAAFGLAVILIGGAASLWWLKTPTRTVSEEQVVEPTTKQLASKSPIGCDSEGAVFQDDFAHNNDKWTELGAYQSGSNVAYADSHLVIKARPSGYRPLLYAPLILVKGSVCLILQSPDLIKDADDSDAGLIFWSPNLSNFDSVVITPSGKFSMYRMLNNDFITIKSPTLLDAINRGSSAFNKIEVALQSLEVTAFINGTRAAAFRGQPARDSHIGIIATSEKTQFNEWRFHKIVAHEVK
jgi:hypothetical protein